MSCSAPASPSKTTFTIEGFCHFEKAVIRSGVRIGPFARLRPGADIGQARISAISLRSRRRYRGGRQDQSSQLYRRCACWRQDQYRCGHDHLQLRRVRQTLHRYRRGRLHRLGCGNCRACKDRRWRLCRRGFGDRQRCSARLACTHACRAYREAGLGGALPCPQGGGKAEVKGVDIMCGIVGILGKGDVAPSHSRGFEAT